MQLHLKHAHGRESLFVAGSDPGITVEREGRDPLGAKILSAGEDELVLEIEGRRHRVHYWREGPTLHLHLDGATIRFDLEDPDREDGDGGGEQDPVLRSPMPGRILAVLTTEGTHVEAGDPLVRMEAMKMEIDVAAPLTGRVVSVGVAEGDLVEPDAELVRIEPDSREG